MTRLEMLLSPKEHECTTAVSSMLLERMIGVTPHLTRESQTRMARAPQAAFPGTGQ